MTTSPSEPTGPLSARRFSEADLPELDDGKPGFGGAVAWTLAGTVLPGLGLWRAGRRVLGGIILGVVLLGLGGLGAYFLLNRKTVEGAVLTNDNLLYGIAGALIVIAVLWSVVVTVSHLQLRSRPATIPQRLISGLFVGVLVFAICGSLGVAANVAVSAPEGLSGLSNTVVNQDDPWDGQTRVNILVMGGDWDSDRGLSLGIRPDSISVASIDTTTGATTLINVPRQTAKMPFPKDSVLHKLYPNGFYNGDPGDQEYALNAIYNNVPTKLKEAKANNKKLDLGNLDVAANAAKKDSDPTKIDIGATATELAVGEALGLKINYYVLVNMDGFKDIVNSIGGVTVNVNDRIPMGGKNGPHGAVDGVPPAHWIEIGANKHLTGTQALWFARGRYGTSDYKRMERQQCVINAVIKQADPPTVLKNIDSLMKAAAKTIRTDVPRGLLPAAADLAVKMKAHSISNVLLTAKLGFSTTNPNWTDVRARIAKAFKTASETTSASPSASASASASTKPSSKTTASPSGTATAKVNNLDDACAYHPNK
jgi:polyisoprenyl-teichoic acid--peptidoglycan teichoic acid transferase